MEGRKVGAPAGGAGSGVGLGLRGLVCWRGLWAGARGLGAEGVRVLSGGADAEVGLRCGSPTLTLSH